MAKYVFELKGEALVPGSDRLYTFKLVCEAPILEDAIVIITRDIRRVLRTKDVAILYRGTRLLTYRTGSDVRIVRR
jgi:hypothetical protein